MLNQMRGPLPDECSNILIKTGLLLLCVVLAAALSGCGSIKKRTDNAEFRNGLRFDENGSLTDAPEVEIPLWKSTGLKEKPRDVVPPRR